MARMRRRKSLTAPCGKQVGEHLPAIQRRDRQHVEDRQHDVEEDAVLGHPGDPFADTPPTTFWLTIMMNAQIVAMTRFDSGPAAVTETMLPRGLRMLRESTGTGFAQPNMKPLPDRAGCPAPGSCRSGRRDGPG